MSSRSTVCLWTKVVLLGIVLFTGSLTQAAQPLFEGYYKYSDGTGQHIGYSIIRNEFDAKKKGAHRSELPAHSSRLYPDSGKPSDSLQRQAPPPLTGVPPDHTPRDSNH